MSRCAEASAPNPALRMAEFVHFFHLPRPDTRAGFSPGAVIRWSAVRALPLLLRKEECNLKRRSTRFLFFFGMDLRFLIRSRNPGPRPSSKHGLASTSSWISRRLRLPSPPLPGLRPSWLPEWRLALAPSAATAESANTLSACCNDSMPHHDAMLEGSRAKGHNCT